eukprot:ANDGO_03357.mRNA.1 Hercynine oxygenase
MKQLSLPGLDLNQLSCDNVKAYFLNTYDLYEDLFRTLASDDVLYMQPDRLRRKLIFYLGHTAVFYAVKFRRAGCLAAPINEQYERDFEVGVDEMSWDDLTQDTKLDRVPASSVWKYRDTVREMVIAQIESFDWKKPVRWDSKEWVVMMGMEHERIHYETSSVLIRQLPIHCVKRPAWAKYGPSSKSPDDSQQPLRNQLVRIPGQVVRLGKDYSFPLYGWDVEYGTRIESIRPFLVSQFYITNAEFLEFVNAGGYQDPGYWTSEGWGWVQFKSSSNKSCHPLFWVPSVDAETGFKLRLMWDEIDLPLTWPVEVNYLEASAYAKWRTSVENPASDFRLITEAEHHAMRPISKLPVSRGALSDVSCQANFDANFMVRYTSSTPVNMHAPTEHGVYDVFGNVWCWTETDNQPFPGFRTHELYEDFSTPCFDGKHNIIVGGSWVSTGNEASGYARYAFRRHFHQHAGFRIAREMTAQEVETGRLNAATEMSQSTKEQDENIYETQKLVDEYMLFHYGSDDDIMPYPFGPKSALQFPKRCGDLLVQMFVKYGEHTGVDTADLRALDLGCAVGRSTLEMARYFGHSIGIDYSHAFVKACQQVLQSRSASFRRIEQGEIATSISRELDDDLKSALADASRTVHFQQGDACLLDPKDIGGTVNALLAANLVDRVHSPGMMLDRLAALVAPGGVLVLTSPFTWLEQFTPKREWMGGFYDEQGHAVETSDAVVQALRDRGFSLCERRDLPFVIREHARKYQWSVAQAIVLKKYIC